MAESLAYLCLPMGDIPIALVVRYAPRMKVPAGSSPVMTAAEVCACIRFNREAIDEWRKSQGYPAPPKPENG